MRRYQWSLLGLSLLLFFAASVSAQSYRLNSLSEQLATQAQDLAEQSYSDYSNNRFSNRSDVEALYLAQQFSASASVFRRMVRDNRRESELRDAALILTDLARRSGGGFARRSQWTSVQRTLEDILRELNVGRPGGGGRGDDDGRTTGRVRWRGRVDAEVNLVISDNTVEVRTLGGSEYGQGTYNFTSPLPRRRLNVNVTRLSGRGNVAVIQQPSRDNNFTAVVQILDPSGGARDYDIEVTW